MTIMDTLDENRKKWNRISAFCAEYLEKAGILTKRTRSIGDKLMDTLFKNEKTCRMPADMWSDHITVSVWFDAEYLPELMDCRKYTEQCLQRCLQDAPAAFGTADCLVYLRYETGDTIISARITLVERDSPLVTYTEKLIQFTDKEALSRIGMLLALLAGMGAADAFNESAPVTRKNDPMANKEAILRILARPSMPENVLQELEESFLAGRTERETEEKLTALL